MACAVLSVCILLAFLLLSHNSSFSLCHPAIALPSSGGDSIVDILKENGLPIGLIPAGSVKSFWYADNGDFEIDLERTCYAEFVNKVYYAKKISGKIGYGSISDLSGIQAKEFLFWFSVTGIHVDIPSSGYIYFEIGAITKKLSLSLFDEIPDCESGLRWI